MVKRQTKIDEFITQTLFIYCFMLFIINNCIALYFSSNNEYIQKLGIEKHLDKNYPGWSDYEIDLTEIPKRDWELALEEKQDVANVIADFTGS